MDLEALQLCSRFAIQPNKLGYCGLPTAHQKFLDCLKNKKCDGVEQEIKQFIVLHPYLKTISEITGLGEFSSPVIESYWYGNDLLEQVTVKNYPLLLANLKRQGVPDFLIAEISTKPLNTFIPIHLFNILFVGVGKASGSVPFNLESINNCMIRWGKVTAINSEYQIKTVILNSEFKLVPTTQKVSLNSSLVDDLKIGDRVTLHWGGIADRPTSKQLKNLKHWTTKLLTNL